MTTTFSNLDSLGIDSELAVNMFNDSHSEGWCFDKPGGRYMVDPRIIHETMLPLDRHTVVRLNKHMGMNKLQMGLWAATKMMQK